MSSKNKWHWSEALAVRPEDAKKTMEEDRQMNRFSAPDAIDRNGCLGWRGNDRFRRKEQYMRERGYRPSR
jgi:hypothetical protein